MSIHHCRAASISRAVDDSYAELPGAVADIEGSAFVGIIKRGVRVVMYFNKGLEVAEYDLFKTNGRSPAEVQLSKGAGDIGRIGGLGNVVFHARPQHEVEKAGVGLHLKLQKIIPANVVETVAVGGAVAFVLAAFLVELHLRNPAHVFAVDELCTHGAVKANDVFLFNYLR